MRTILAAIVIYFAPHSLLAQPPAAACAAVNLGQNWKEAVKQQFWFTPQGSRLMPYAWFLALEAPWAEIPFRGAHVMDDLLGYISMGRSTANPDALPIGFAKVRSFEGETYVGLTCAACHTAKLELPGVTRIVEGAPAMADFSTFLSWIVDALEKTLGDGAKFERFAKSVLGPNGAAAAKQALRTALESQTQKLRERRVRNAHTEPYGYSRVDAFGHILNELLAKDLGIPANRREPNAPVSYPALWDTPRHDRVQWNGAAPNIGNIGPMMRNIGEVIGVFGELRMRPIPLTVPIYPSSIRTDRLDDLEGALHSLWSPVWPKACLPIEQARVSRGRVLYAGACKGCHEAIDRSAPTKFRAKMIPIQPDLKTDATMATNFASRTAITGRLKGTPIRLLPLPAFGETASGAEILGNATLGVYFGGGLSMLADRFPDPASILRTIDKNDAKTVLDTMMDKSPHYKARPLNGIWATAPYLHNGSVPNLEQLLLPPDQRDKQFYVGSRRFDPAKVGLSMEKDTHRGFLFDTTKPGNRNTGHGWTSDFSPEQRRDLLEYLKTL